MPKNKRVADMADEALTRQAKAHIERTGEPFEEALKGVLETEAGSLESSVRGTTATMGHGSGRRAFSGNG